MYPFKALRHSVNIPNIPLVDTDRDKIIDVNIRACTMLRYSHQELLALPMSAIHPHELPDLHRFTRSDQEHGKGWTNELRCGTVDHQQD